MRLFSVRNLFAGLAVTALLSANAWAAPISFGGHYYDVIAAQAITWDDAQLRPCLASILVSRAIS